jgi:hypothetical protein
MFNWRSDSATDEGARAEYLLAMTAAATLTMIFSLLAGLKWQACLMLMAAIAVLVGGVLFTFLELHRLALRVRGRKKTRTGQDDIIGANQSAIAMKHLALFEQRQRIAQEVAASNEPYPHHEAHSESPGEDQGQLTSHLPGSTPFLETLDAKSRRVKRK